MMRREVGAGGEAEASAGREEQLQGCVAGDRWGRGPPRLRRGRYHANRHETRALRRDASLRDLI